MNNTDMVPTLDNMHSMENQSSVMQPDSSRLHLQKSWCFPFSRVEEIVENDREQSQTRSTSRDTETLLTTKSQSHNSLDVSPLRQCLFSNQGSKLQDNFNSAHKTSSNTKELACPGTSNIITDQELPKTSKLWSTELGNETSVGVPCITVQVENGDPVPLECTDPIDLYNACRSFYQSRLESTRRWKERWRESELFEEEFSLKPTRRRTFRSPIEKAMATLKKEMACLMEQDLCLMKQLLTMNEEIEELKWRRRQHQCGWGSSSSCYSSSMVHSTASLATVGEHDCESRSSSPQSSSMPLLDANSNPSGSFSGERQTNGNLLSVQSSASTQPFRSRAASDSAVRTPKPVQ